MMIAVINATMGFTQAAAGARGTLGGAEDLALDYLETVQWQERTLAGC